MSKKVLGRIDRVTFPKLNLYNVPVKMDTGAYTSSIHCFKIIHENNTLRCIFKSHTHENFGTSEITFTEFVRTKVKSSNGMKETRFKIKSEIIIFGKTYKINLTLSTRDDMKFPVLIGRQFLKNKFLVDVALENLSFNQN